MSDQELNEKEKGMKKKKKLEMKGREEEHHKSLHEKSCFQRGMERDGKISMLMIKRRWMRNINGI